MFIWVLKPDTIILSLCHAPNNQLIIPPLVTFPCRLTHSKAGDITIERLELVNSYAEGVAYFCCGQELLRTSCMLLRPIRRALFLGAPVQSLS